MGLDAGAPLPAPAAGGECGGAGDLPGGGHTRRLRGALGPLLHGAPLSRSAVSRIVATLKGSLDAWPTQPLADREVVFAYLDALMLRVRSAGKVVSAPVLAVVGVLADGQKVLLTLELCSGGESYEAWKGCLDGSRPRAPRAAARHHRRPRGAAARRRRGVAPGGGAALQCPQAAQHGAQGPEARAGRGAGGFPCDRLCRQCRGGPDSVGEVRTVWGKRCPGVVKSLQEGGTELLTFLSFPEAQWKTLRTTNVIERLNESSGAA